MQLAPVEHKLKKIGEFETKAFSIKASAKAFQILSDSLYSDKIAAIIRELSCNALDAHKAANQTKPFHIHLPNWLEPNFWIRDYGTGLSKESIENIYTTYFESTKNDSNDYIGCLGLGSKTPFSYTTQFTITSFFNGMKYCYSAFINDEDGCPSVSLLGEAASEEENGLQIEFAVNAMDQTNFATKAEKVLAWFSEQPTISGQKINVKPFSEKYIHNGINWHVFTDTEATSYSYSTNSCAYVKMGNIAYPIDHSKMPSGFKLQEYLTFPIVFDMDIGDVEIAPSREALSYNKKTVASLTARIENFSEEFTAIINNDLDKLPSFGAACKFASNNGYWLTQNRLLRHLVETSKIHYKQKKLQTSISYYAIRDVMSKYFGISFHIYEYGTLHARYSNHSYSEDVVILDLDQKANEKKIRDVLSHNKTCKAYVISNKIPLKDREKFLDYLDYDESVIKEFSKLEVPPPPEKKKRKTPLANATPRKKGSKAWLYQGDKYRTVSGQRGFWVESEEIDFDGPFDKEYVYVYIDNFFLSEKHHIHVSIENYARFIDTKVYGLTTRQYDKISSSDKWIKLDDYCRTKLAAEYEKLNMDEYPEIWHTSRMSLSSSSDFWKTMPSCDLKTSYEALKLDREPHKYDRISRDYLSFLDFSSDLYKAVYSKTQLTSQQEWLKDNANSNLALFIEKFKEYPLLFELSDFRYFKMAIGLDDEDTENDVYYDYIIAKENKEKAS